MSSKKEVSEYLLSLTNSRRKPRSSDSFISPEKNNCVALDISNNSSSKSVDDKDCTDNLINSCSQTSRHEFDSIISNTSSTSRNITSDSFISPEKYNCFTIDTSKDSTFVNDKGSADQLISDCSPRSRNELDLIDSNISSTSRIFTQGHKDIIRSPTPPIVPSAEELKNMLIAKYYSVQGNVTEFSSKGSVVEIVKLLIRFYNEKSVILLNESNHTYLHPCPNGNNLLHHNSCKLFSISPYNWQKRVIMCNVCQEINDRTTRKIRQKVPEESMTRFRPFNTLSPESKQKSYKKCQLIIKSKNRLISRLQSFIKDDTSYIKFAKDSSVKAMVSTAIKSLMKESGVTKEFIHKEFLEMQLKGESCHDGEISEINQCVNVLMEQIKNMSLQLNGNQKAVRYSPYIINIAMALFLRNRKSYDDLRASGLLCLPSPRTLSNITKVTKVEPGGDPKLYMSILEENDDSEKDIIGHLMLDEIKLKNGIAFNAKSNEITGFVEGGLNTKTMITEMLGMGNEENDNVVKQKTVYCNQWRFRSTRGVVHNGDFFFNTGSLDANELLRQMMEVILAYETCGIKVFGIVSDAGGGNEGFFKILTQNIARVGPWSDIGAVRFRNPVDSSRFVYIWSCSTHGLKAIRNNLFRSQPKLARSFVKSGISFGWKQVEDIYMRDQDRKKKCDLPITKLEKHAIVLDKYTTMNAKYAKQPFQESTISELSAYLMKHLNIKFDRESNVESQWHKFLFYHNLISEKIAESTYEHIKQSHCLMEYLVAVHGIFIERLLNKNWKISRDNICQETENMKEAVTYFTDWMSQKADVQVEKNITSLKLTNFTWQQKLIKTYY